MAHQLDGCIALAVETEGAKRFAGTVTEIQDNVCRLQVRGDVGLPRGTHLRIAFKTGGGQASADAQVAVSSENKVVLVLTSPVVVFQARSSRRKQVRNVTAVCSADNFEINLRIMDVSEGGFRFEADIPLPSDQTIPIQFSFDGQLVESMCQVVRQEQNELGYIAGGAKFCNLSRVEMARLKRNIQYFQ